MTPVHQHIAHDVWNWFRNLCVLVTICSLAANGLPKSSKLDAHPEAKAWYCAFIDIVAGFALNLRKSLPSLDMEWMGFRSHPHVRRSPRDPQRDGCRHL